MHRKHTKSKGVFRNRCLTEPVHAIRAPHKMFTVLSEYIGYTSYSKVHTYSLYQRQCTQSTYIPRVQQCLSQVCSLDRIGTPLPQASVPPPPQPNGGGGHSNAGERGPKFGRLEKEPSTLTEIIRSILRGVRYAKLLRVLFLHRRSPS